MTPERFKIFCLPDSREAYFRPIESAFGKMADFLYESGEDVRALAKEAPDLLLYINDVSYLSARYVQLANELKIPTLLLQDGILEWRCHFENPQKVFGDGPPQYYPVLADKMACMGSQTARQLSLWGNQAKLEITGMPRLDSLLQATACRINPPGKKLLVMTASTPWFTEEQRDVTLKALRDLKNVLSNHSGWDVTWRLTKDIDQWLGVDNRFGTRDVGELSEIIKSVDAVITTPSTVIVESMLLGRPVAVLDYGDHPAYVHTAWRITSPDGIARTLHELKNPAPLKMMYQDHSCRDVLRRDGAAAPRVKELIVKMIDCGRAARAEGRDIVYPAAIIAPEPGLPSPAFALGEMYPASRIFQESSVEVLRLRLSRAEKDNERLRNQLKTRSPGYWLGLACKHAVKKIKRSFGKI